MQKKPGKNPSNDAEEPDDSDQDSASQTIPDFGFDTAAWREYCKSTAQFPAGYTYLAQLMGHDLGNTVDAATIPGAADSSHPRLNLIDHPLTLETIYGKGPAAAGPCYNTRNCLFRLGDGAMQAEKVVFTADEPAEPLLADMRNRDTLMLHQLAVLWMQYHNKIARALMRDDGFTEHAHAQRSYFAEVFLRARRIVISTWHNVLLHDLLPRIAHPAALDLPDDALESVILLDEIPVLNGVMRAFHALPLAQYRLNAGLTAPFGELRAGKVGERKNWRIDWRYFFGPDATNQTGFSASYSPLFTVLSGRSIMQADLASAINALPYDQVHDQTIAAHSLLPETLKRDISAQNLERLFNQQAAALGLAPLPDGAFAQLPLFLLLLLEAQFFSDSGSLGPFGSALLRRFLQHKIGRIEAGQTTPGTPGGMTAPQSIESLIQFVKHP